MALSSHKESSPPPPQKPRGKKWIPLAVLGVLLLGGVIWKMRSGGEDEAPAGGPGASMARAAVVRTVPVSTGNIIDTLAVTGSLRSNQSLNLSSKVQGRVARVHVNEGQRITRGQLLVSLETEDLQTAVAGAQANLKSAQVRRQQAASGLPGKVQGVLTAVQQAEANLATAQARYQQALLNEPLRVQQVESGLQQAETNLSMAQARYQQARLSEPSKVQQAQGQVSTAKEAVKTAEARLAQARTSARQTEQQVAAEIKGAESLVASRQAALAEVKRGSRAQQIAQAQAQVNQAEAELRNARTELERARTLFEGGAAPRALLDTARTRAEIAQAQVDTAKQNLSLVREGSTNEQILQAEEAVAQAQSQLLQAQAGRARIPVAESEVTAALAALSQAQEGVRTAEANLSQVPVAAQDTRVAREAVDQAQAALAQARADRAQIPITRQETRVAQQAVEQARAALEAARANRSQIPVARQDIQAAEAGVEQARAQLEQAQINLKNARIYSPVSGVVNTKQTEVGESVGPGTPLMNLVALDAVYFEAQVSENNVPLIHLNQPVSVLIPAVQQQALEGFVSELIPVADPRSRQFRVRVTIPDPNKRLTPGAFARGTITTEAVYNALTVPTETIMREDDQAYVFVAVGEGRERTAEKRVIQTGLESGGQTQILSGLEEGDEVILANSTISDQDKVQVMETTRTPEAGEAGGKVDEEADAEPETAGEERRQRRPGSRRP